MTLYHGTSIVAVTLKRMTFSGSGWAGSRLSGIERKIVEWVT